MPLTIRASPHTTESPTFLGSIPAKATSSEKICGADTGDTLYIFCSDNPLVSLGDQDGNLKKLKASSWTRIQKHLSSGPYLFLRQLLIFLFFPFLLLFFFFFFELGNLYYNYTNRFTYCYLDPVLYNIILWGKELCISDFRNKYASY